MKAMTDTPTESISDPEGQPVDAVGRTAVSSRGTERTRISAAWIWVIVGAVVLTLLLVFILQNTKSVKVSFFTANGTLPLGVALLLAAVGGLLLAGVVASLRIWQLRRRLTGQRRVARRRPDLASTRPIEAEGPEDAP
jgi:lipopolysaccharide assembly protein A